MAIISDGVLECKPFSDKTALCRGRTFFSRKLVEGGSSLRICVWGCRSSNNINNGSVHSDYQNIAGEKLSRRKDDAILPSHMEESRAVRWWLPLFDWSQGDLERWADDDCINEWNTKGKGMDKSSDYNEK